jgi:hypothetical protein
MSNERLTSSQIVLLMGDAVGRSGGQVLFKVAAPALASPTEQRRSGFLACCTNSIFFRRWYSTPG